MLGSTRATTLLLAIGLAGLSLALLMTRGGLLAGLGLVAGSAMLTKALWRPGAADVRWTAGLLAGWAALWGVALGSVYLGWESGEVVVLRPLDPVTGELSELRVWVVDDAQTGHPVVFYDGSRERLAAIGSQATLEWVRGGSVHRSRPTLHWLDDAPPEFVARITELFDAKYGDLGWAANVFYVLAGRAAGRTFGILELAPAAPE
ncbi:MAG: hypothetical protein AAF430_24915 [Myxococcota bacterium]